MLGCTEKKEQTIEEKSTVEEQVKNTLGIKIYNNITTLESRRDIPREANMMSEIFTGLKKNQWKVNEDVTLNLCGQGRTFVINIGIDEYKYQNDVLDEDEKLNYTWVRDAAVLSLKLKDSCKTFKEMTLFDTNATQVNIMNNLNKLEKLVKSDDVVIFTYSGLVSSNGYSTQFFTTNTRDYYLNKQSIEYDDVVSILDKLKVKTFILINGHYIGTGC